MINHHSLLLEHNHRILLQVTHINELALLLHLRMLTDQQPTHVGEEESPGGIMGICISVRELVMHSMISGPFVDRVLEGDRLQDHQEDSQWQASFVGLVGPQSMSSGCDPKGSRHSCGKSCKIRGKELLLLFNQEFNNFCLYCMS